MSDIPWGTVPPDYTPMKGMRVRVSPLTRVTLVELDYFADPGKDSDEWLAKASQGMTEGDVEREFKRNRTLSEGDAFYWEFRDNGGRETYVHKCPGLVEGLHVSRSYDLGVRRPACVWYQYDPYADRLWFLREFMPHDCGTHDFRDVVKYLSGQMSYADLSGDAMYWADEVGARDWNPEPPWFGEYVGECKAGGVEPFVDFAGKFEAFRRQAAAMNNPEETTDADVMAAGGIHLVEWGGPVKARAKVMRRLLKIRPDGYPGVFFDPACEELIQAFEGALTFHKPTEEEPIPDRPRKDGHFDNIHDAGTYGPAHEVPAEDVKPAPPPKRVTWDPTTRARVEEDIGQGENLWRENRYGWGR